MSDPMTRWHEVMAKRDPDGIAPLLAEDVVFRSPAVHRPQEGKAITAKYLRAAMTVLGGADFRYVGEWRAERSCVLEFETKLGDIFVNGVDIIGWNAEGLITSFKVMVRPLKGLNAVLPLMAEALVAEGA